MFTLVVFKHNDEDGSRAQLLKVKHSDAPVKIAKIISMLDEVEHVEVMSGNDVVLVTTNGTLTFTQH